MDVSQIGVGIYDTTKQQIDPTNRAARISVRPAEIGVFGAYSFAIASGIMAAGLAAGSPIFSFKWSSVVANALIRRVRLSAGTDATAFAQGSTIFDMIRASKLPAQYTGGQTLTLTGQDQARSTRFSASQQQIVASAVGNIVVANTATLVAGSPAPTLDSNAMAILVSSVGAVPANYVIPPSLLWDETDVKKNSLELLNNQGFIVRATVPITGTWKFGVEVDWDEIDPARYYQ